jgi:hypothetical protein
VYSGIGDGRLIRFASEDSYETYVRVGKDKPECGKALEAEPECGRPLGLAFHKGTGDLYVCDAYFGLLKLDSKTRSMTKIPLSHEPFFCNSVVIVGKGKDETIYITDSSDKFRRNQVLLSVLEKAPRGRLLAYRPSDNTTSIVLDNLYFPNGLTTSFDGKALLLISMDDASILRVGLEGKDKHKVTIFASNIPGTPDNIAKFPKELKRDFFSSNSTLSSTKDLYKDTYLIGCGARRTPVDWALGYLPFVRELLTLLPYPTMARFIGMVAKSNATVIEYDTDGNLLGAYVDPTGSFKFVSEGLVHDGKMMLGTWLISQSMAVATVK